MRIPYDKSYLRLDFAKELVKKLRESGKYNRVWMQSYLKERERDGNLATFVKVWVDTKY